MDEASLRENAQGRIWTGTKAKEKKFIDEFGGLYEAVQYAKQETNLGEDCEVTYFRVPVGFGLPSFAGSMFQSDAKPTLWNLFEKKRITVEF